MRCRASQACFCASRFFPIKSILRNEDGSWTSSSLTMLSKSASHIAAPSTSVVKWLSGRRKRSDSIGKTAP
eukprot:497621-Rhodomonas_salina.1